MITYGVNSRYETGEEKYLNGCKRSGGDQIVLNHSQQQEANEDEVEDGADNSEEKDGSDIAKEVVVVKGPGGLQNDGRKQVEEEHV